MGRDRKSQALEALKLRILTLDIVPGADLDEAVLSDAYGISRTPLREVLQRLAGEGYAELAPNRGARVASMDLAAMRGFFETAPMVYAAVARLAARNRSVSGLTSLREIQAAFRAAVEDGDAAAAALSNHRFHAQIGEMAANAYLAPSLARMLIDHTRLSQTFYRPATSADAARIATACEQHDAMIAAFEAGDEAAAVDLTLAHWDLSRDRMADFVRPDPLPFEMETTHAV